jgi:hypothetical protein
MPDSHPCCGQFTYRQRANRLAYRLWPLTPDGGKPSTSLDQSLDYRAASALEVRILCHEFEREIGDDYDEVPSWITYHMDDAARRGDTTE